MHVAAHLTPDFSSFVAGDRGISSGEAERLIEEWVAGYRSQAPRPIRFLHRDADPAAGYSSRSDE